MLFAVSQATPVYNGWRHFYFTYISILLAAGYAVACLCEIGKKYKREIIVEAVGMLYVIALAMGIALNYPHEHSFYNILAGNDVVNNYELDYWSMSANQALKTISERVEEGELAAVGVVNLPTMWGVRGNYNIMQDVDKEKVRVIEDIDLWREADYVIINTTYAVMYNENEYNEIKEGYHLIEEFSSYGNVICEIYQK